jgi:hypothetical protein
MSLQGWKTCLKDTAGLPASVRCALEILHAQVLAMTRYVGSRNARPFAFFGGISTAPLSNTNGNSSLSYAPSTNAAANASDGFILS